MSYHLRILPFLLLLVLPALGGRSAALSAHCGEVGRPTNPDTTVNRIPTASFGSEVPYSALKEQHNPRAIPPPEIRELRTLVVNTSSVPTMKRDTPGLDIKDVQEAVDDETGEGEEEAGEDVLPTNVTELPVDELHPGVDRVVLMKEIITILSTRYKWGGMDAVRGLDCSAFTSTVYSRFAGLWIPRTSTTQYYYDEAVPVKKNDLKVGDLVFFRTRPNFGSPVSHVGIYVGAGCFAHASSKRGVIISSLSGYYARSYVGARRVLRDNQ